MPRILRCMSVECIAWDFDGAVVARVYPQFAGWVPIKQIFKPAA